MTPGGSSKTNLCPNCGGSKLAGSTPCPKCGYVAPSSRGGFPWLLIIALILIIPLGTVGGCFAWISTGNKGYESIQWLVFPLAIEIGSFGTGVVLPIANIVIKATKSRK